MSLNWEKKQLPLQLLDYFLLKRTITLLTSENPVLKIIQFNQNNQRYCDSQLDRQQIVWSIATDQLVQVVLDPRQVGERADGHQAAQSKVK